MNFQEIANMVRDKEMNLGEVLNFLPENMPQEPSEIKQVLMWLVMIVNTELKRKVKEDLRSYSPTIIPEIIRQMEEGRKWRRSK